MDYDFITTCNWTATGTYTLSAYRGAYKTSIAADVSLYYRKKGDTTWIETTDGTISITSTGEWEVGNDWEKSGNDCLTHSYYGITAIDECTKVEFDEIGSAVGNYFMVYCWYNCTNLESMPSDFNLPSEITTTGTKFLYSCWQGCTALTTMGNDFTMPSSLETVGDYFLDSCWRSCSSLTSMPTGFNLPSGLTTIGDHFMNSSLWDCTALTSMPSGFNIPSGITTTGDSFFKYCWRGCTSLASMPIDFNIPTGITTVGTNFLDQCWSGCTSLASMPSGFQIPTGLTTIGTYFMASCWYNCTALDDDDYTENITFEFTTGANVFGGTCPITTASPIVGTKTTPVSVAVNREVAPDFISTCNWTATGTYTLAAFRGNETDISSSVSLFYRKKGDTTWIETTNGTISITSTGEWEVGNHWDKDGNDCLYHLYLQITAIDKCTNMEFDETALGSNTGNCFLLGMFYGCTNLASMPVGFTLPSGITTVGTWFMNAMFYGCSSLTSMPTGFNLPTGITTVGDHFLDQCWGGGCGITSMPSGFNIPTGITTVGDYFLFSCWNSSSIASMPSGFNIPSGLTTIGDYFMTSCWYNCTALDDDGTTENITFEFTTGTDIFGGTCPITTASPIVGTKTTPVNVAVNRTSATSFPDIKINIGDTWKVVTDIQINIGDTWKTIDASGSQINIGDTWKDLAS